MDATCSCEYTHGQNLTTLCTPYILVQYVSHGHMKLLVWSSVFENIANIRHFPGKDVMCSEGEAKHLEQ